MYMILFIGQDDVDDLSYFFVIRKMIVGLLFGPQAYYDAFG